MGMALSVLHGAVTEEVAQIALSSPFQVHVPLAPGEALLLANAGFWDAKREEMRLDLGNEEVQVRIAEYKINVLYPHIALLLHTPRVSYQRERRLARKGGGDSTQDREQSSCGVQSDGRGVGGSGGGDDEAGNGEVKELTSDGNEAKELIFDGFASQLGRYVFPPAKGDLEGWSLLLSEHDRWKVGWESVNEGGRAGSGGERDWAVDEQEQHGE